MPAPEQQDWNPEAYARFRGFRLRPALDLLAQVSALPPGDVVDLGCGDGALGEALVAKFRRNLVGVDKSVAMLRVADQVVVDGRPVYDSLIETDAAEWGPRDAPALIFSNAALHWVGDHASLLPRLISMLVPGGTLAVQMPRQFGAPSHQLLWTVAANLFPERFDPVPPDPPVAAPDVYARMLDRLGEVSIWETEYLQRLGPNAAALATGHPVRHFTQSTAMRPILARLNAAEAKDFVNAYDAQLLMAYPVENDGAALFPFRRLFITVRTRTD